MFGNQKRILALEARLDALDARLDQQAADLQARIDQTLDQLRARADQDPDARTRLLLNTVAEDLRRDLQGALASAERIRTLHADLEARVGGNAARTTPTSMPLDALHQAPATGFVSIWFEGGRTDTVNLKVGWTSPPDRTVGRLNTTNDINSYIATVVRQGEFWIASTGNGPGQSGLRCVYTPFL